MVGDDAHSLRNTFELAQGLAGLGRLRFAERWRWEPTGVIGAVLVLMMVLLCVIRWHSAEPMYNPPASAGGPH